MEFNVTYSSTSTGSFKIIINTLEELLDFVRKQEEDNLTNNVIINRITYIENKISYEEFELEIYDTWRE